LTPLATKESLLEAAGYRYSFDRQVYFNRSARKLFSIEFVADHSEAEIERSIREPTCAQEWKFYFNVEPSDSVRGEIQSLIG